MKPHNLPEHAADLPPRAWKRARGCGPDGGNCVEINLSPAGYVGVRDSKPAAPELLIFPAHAWRRFLVSARRGR